MAGAAGWATRHLRQPRCRPLEVGEVEEGDIGSAARLAEPAVHEQRAPRAAVRRELGGGVEGAGGGAGESTEDGLSLS